MSQPSEADSRRDPEQQSEPEIEVEETRDLDPLDEDADDVRGGSCG